jgi:hypothetical protein
MAKNLQDLLEAGTKESIQEFSESIFKALREYSILYYSFFSLKKYILIDKTLKFPTSLTMNESSSGLRAKILVNPDIGSYLDQDWLFFIAHDCMHYLQ